MGLDLLCNPAACTFTPYQVLNILRSPGGRPMRSSEPIKLGFQTTMRAAVNVFALYEQRGDAVLVPAAPEILLDPVSDKPYKFMRYALSLSRAFDRTVDQSPSSAAFP